MQRPPGGLRLLAGPAYTCVLSRRASADSALHVSNMSGQHITNLVVTARARAGDGKEALAIVFPINAEEGSLQSSSASAGFAAALAIHLAVRPCAAVRR